jgi:tRNA modification GTPase
MINSLVDVIAAIATPLGEGGISVIRVSGSSAFNVAESVFRGASSLDGSESHTAHVGHIVGRTGETIDQVVAVVYREPHSYTGENTVEISCHGGLFVTRLILDELLSAGARMAEPGEFTRRAFLNGKMDLLQAEAVADLIRAKTDLSHQASLRQLEGKLSSVVRSLRQELLNISSLLEIELDFSEEGIEVADKNEIGNKIRLIVDQLKNLLDSYRVGKISREGVKAVIVGKPNVGKSSIINNLLNENRAIVTDVPGTTRDVLREELDIGGVLFTIADTAGLRKSDDVVEREGISRTHSEAMSADLILYIVDVSGPVTDEDRKIFAQIKLSNNLAGTIVVGNKNDLTDQKEKFIREFIADDPHYILCSAKTGEGMEELKTEMVKIALRNDQHLIEKSTTITNLRHKQAIEKALSNLNVALTDIRENKSNEFSSLDLRLAMDNLGEIIGEVTSEDLLNNIFSKFCIGK